MGKSLIQSKTLWFNLVLGLATVITQSSGDLAQVLGVAADPMVLAVITAVGNIALRYFFTTQPIKSVI